MNSIVVDCHIGNLIIQSWILNSTQQKDFWKFFIYVPTWKASKMFFNGFPAIRVGRDMEYGIDPDSPNFLEKMKNKEQKKVSYKKLKWNKFSSLSFEYCQMFCQIKVLRCKPSISSIIKLTAAVTQVYNIHICPSSSFEIIIKNVVNNKIDFREFFNRDQWSIYL